MNTYVLVFIFVIINTFRVDAVPHHYHDHLLLASDFNNQHHRREYVDETRVARQGYPINQAYNPYGLISTNPGANAGVAGIPYVNHALLPPNLPNPDDGLQSRFGLWGDGGAGAGAGGFLNGYIGGHLDGHIGGHIGGGVNAAANAAAGANAGFYPGIPTGY